jgi:hypothetical protein
MQSTDVLRLQMLWQNLALIQRKLALVQGT